LTRDEMQEVVVNDLVDPAVRAGEPIIDRRDGAQNLRRDARFLLHLAYGRFGSGLLPLQVPFGQAPFDPSSAVAQGDDRLERLPVLYLDHDLTRRGFVDDG